MNTVETDGDDAIELSHEHQPHNDLWKQVIDAELAHPDVAWDDFVRADDDVDIAVPCANEGIVCEVQALCNAQDSDD